MNLIVLDRDGVINQDSDAHIKTVEEWVPIPGSLEAIARLNHAGYRVVVATNQSGLARGLFTIDALNAIHRKMRRALGQVGGQIEAVFFCPHKPSDDCLCRKPRPGLLEDIGQRLQVDMTGVPVVGDSLRDIQAALAVGSAPFLVLTGKGRLTARNNPTEIEQIPTFADLSAAVDALLSP
ncbi:MAG: D-glycero-beta-D-manno-heptose 1,7-bisphosphate 7-phosphatase [Pseudomonadota bacterium]|nr:D-glycero-beta-D-manno-heptose 1,7-bisphosphate 7-phosphatase [Pseudomonadota bacterium]